MKNLRTIIVIIFIVCLVLFIQLRSYYFERELSKKGELTVGRIDSIVVMPKLTNIYMSYYFEKVKFITPERKTNKYINKNYVGKFYELKYLKRYPSIVRTNFSKQVTDTTAILKAGFSIEDMEKIK
ncbi:hypothetical protein [Flavobacterium sp.]|uniref:hypothetical protein n=1 Tax=Flavobacterium sp. TaxID=239 RepID=UPI00286E95D7|nr:hypothetical protein [Flavobacterium sp.]